MLEVIRNSERENDILGDFASENDNRPSYVPKLRRKTTLKAHTNECTYSS